MYSLNHLKNDAFGDAKKTLLTMEQKYEPESFWLRKIR